MSKKTTKKVLIVTYYWPPSGGIGVHRCLKFAKYLSEFGWEPVIYTAKNAQYPYLDDSNFKDIPENITVIKRKILEPFNLFKILSGRKVNEPMSNPVHVRDKKQSIIDKASIWIRGNFFIPDARSLWINPSVKFLSSYLAKNPVDAILSDGPPHTNTYIAYKLSKKLNIPWLADFQDPWTQVDYYKDLMLTKRADRKHKRMEQNVFAVASKITIASPSWAKDLEKIGARNVEPVYWGFDEEDFQDLHPEDYGKFTICHTGLLGHDRNPETLIKTLGELITENAGFKKDLSLRLAGMVDFSIKEEINKYGLTENAIFEGNIHRKKALEILISSNILLLPLNKAENVKGRIPGKLFEYLRAGNTILCLGPEGCDSGKIIEETNRGKVCDYDDEKGLRHFILQAYKDYKSGIISNPEPEKIAQYSVKIQTKRISELLNEITQH